MSPTITALPAAGPPGLDDVPICDATTRRARLRGLLGHRDPPPFALRLAPCRSIHTFGMRFPLDLHWLDAGGRTIRVDRDVGPGRLRACRSARAVVEVPSVERPVRGRSSRSRLSWRPS
ncbi:DUF192 domain-containing protein [Conexibacter woesei]|uniref:DUF192 domain-containing protein n=1 Tax=Conexibacter woesei TaxID=191495 RepID=UPI00041F2446|nr:DUF192 domain-containing protein [Conexibacter woesei]